MRILGAEAERNAYNGYAQAQRNSAATIGGMQDGFADNMSQAGTNLQGQVMTPIGAAAGPAERHAKRQMFDGGRA